ncbi:protein CROWDED NUCLEI 4-like [Senna tora]|uniref:Protein CROWDED NUCLEI 4-like n=1 Tax=Senna tora TaxID=362788 RepID=A0A834WAT6_9FABA|nr:protein CROWDED NUCLEI 4-like [Senna tora]
MAKEGEAVEDSEVTETNPPFYELLETYNNLLEDSLKIIEKYGELKISHSKVLKAFGSIKLEKEALEEKIKSMEKEYSMSSLITENRKLKATVDKLKYDLEQFVKGEEKLNLILGSQRSPSDKTGLGFRKENKSFKEKPSRNHDRDDIPEGLITSESSQRPTEEVSNEASPEEAEPEDERGQESLKETETEKKSSDETLAGDSRLTRVKMFDGYEAKFRFETDLRMRSFSPPKEINIDFFYKESFRCFEAFKANGWEYFLNLKEPVYPMLIREFYANLKIDEAVMSSTLLLRGRRAVLTKGLLSELLKCPNAGIYPDLDNDLIIASYNKGEFINELMGRESSICQIGQLGADDRILFHIIDQVIIQAEQRHMKVDLKEFESEEASFQSRIDIGMLHQMQFRKVGKSWVKKGKDLDITPKVEDEYDLPKASKRKMLGNKGKGKGKRVGPYVRKSARLLKEKEKGGTKLVNLKEDKASSHTEKETLVSEETVPKEKSEPLSLSVETISQKTGTKTATSLPASPTVAELLKEPKNEHCVFRMLQETLRSSTFIPDSLERTNTVLKQILDSIQTTNALLTSIQSLLQKQTSKPSVPETILPLRITPQIEDVD